MEAIKVTEELSAHFNMFRASKVGKEFTRDEMKKMLKDLSGLNMTSDQLLLCITHGVNPPIIKVSRGKYSVNPKPVHKDRLQKTMDDYATYVNEHTINPKKRAKIAEHKQNLISKEEAIAKAIALLKKEGYRIQRPETKWIEC